MPRRNASASGFGSGGDVRSATLAFLRCCADTHGAAPIAASAMMSFRRLISQVRACSASFRLPRRLLSPFGAEAETAELAHSAPERFGERIRRQRRGDQGDA